MNYKHPMPEDIRTMSKFFQQLNKTDACIDCHILIEPGLEVCDDCYTAMLIKDGNNTKKD